MKEFLKNPLNGWLFILLVVFDILLATAANAATDTVTTNTDDGSSGTLRQIILNSNPGDTVNFSANLSGSTILLTNGQILLTNNLTIDASALSLGIQINGNGQGRVFYMTNSTVVLNSLIITNGGGNNIYNGGGIYNNGTLTLTNCILSGNSALYNTPGEAAGGGIYNDSNGWLSLNQCTLSGNSAVYNGGCIYNSGIVALNSCILSRNSCGNPVITASGNGGGIYNIGTLTLTNCTLSGNESVASGGGIYSKGTLTVNQCTLSGNVTTNGFLGISSGGGICSDSGGTVTLISCTLSGNAANNGTAPYARGGGIWNSGMLTLNQCTLSENFAIGSSKSTGGAIYNPGGTLTLNECTLSKNFIANTSYNSGSGSGIMNNGVLTLNQCTLSGNLATNISLGGVGIVNAGTLTLSNSIVAGNNAQGIAGDILNTSALTYAGSNIVSKLSGSFTGPTANTNAPLLAPLANYGGFTQTMLPLTNSPAIDAVTNSVINYFATDQRGYPRLSGLHVDIGAVELQQATVTTLAASNITLSNALLNATVIPGDLFSYWYFKYGTNASYGSFSTTNTIPTTNTNAMSISYVLTGLTPGTNVHYQIFVNDGVSIKTGGDTNFTTLVIANNPSVLTGLSPFTNGAFGFSFTNVSGASFTVLASTNIALPLAQWSNLGLAMESPAGSGQYQFTEPQATNSVQCFYRVSSP